LFDELEMPLRHRPSHYEICTLFQTRVFLQFFRRNKYNIRSIYAIIQIIGAPHGCGLRGEDVEEEGESGYGVVCPAAVDDCGKVELSFQYVRSELISGKDKPLGRVRLANEPSL
jgi:hypothetical protein